MNRITYSTSIGSKLDLGEHQCPDCRGLIRPLPPEAQQALDDHLAKPFMRKERIVWCKCDEKKREVLLWRWSMVNLPAKAKTFENLDKPPIEGTQEAVEAVLELISGEATYHILTIQGVAGSGKSHIAEAGLRRAWDNGIVKIRFDKTTRLLGQIRVASFEEQETLVKWYCYRDLLVLDEIGAENETPWTIQVLTDILDERIRLEKKTILTTNLELADMDNSKSFRVGDRIFDTMTGDVRVVTMLSPSHRTGNRP
jgi:DNA replication protein DnaC